MAAVTHLVTTPDTGNTPNTSGSFSPASGDLLIVFVTKEASASGTIASADLTSSVAPTGFTLVRAQAFRSSADTLAVFVANSLTTNTTSRTVTIASGSDAGAGSIISVYGVSGMTRVNSAAIKQQGGQSNQTAGTTPAPAFAGAALTANCCLGAVANATNTAGVTQPASWTESQDTGYTTGAITGLETCFRNSGETGTTITWGSTSASAFASIIIELDTSSPPTGTIAANLLKPTAALTGLVIDAFGSLATNLLIPTSAMTGQRVETGTIAANLLLPTAAMSGQKVETGTISTNLLIPTAAATGQKVEIGALASNLLIPTASMSGVTEEQADVFGTLASNLPLVTSTATGLAAHIGTLTASLPILTGTMSGLAVHHGTLAANLLLPTSSATGLAAHHGTLASNLPKPTSAAEGIARHQGTIAASLAVVTATFTGQKVDTGTLASNLLVVSSTMVGAAGDGVAGNLACSLLILTASMTGTSAVDFVPGNSSTFSSGVRTSGWSANATPSLNSTNGHEWTSDSTTTFNSGNGHEWR